MGECKHLQSNVSQKVNSLPYRDSNVKNVVALKIRFTIVSGHKSENSWRIFLLEVPFE